MRASVVIRSRNEAARLRLALASLAGQAALHEVVVVDDGSTDATPRLLAEAASDLPLVAFRHDIAQGRSSATNAGARAASGDLLIFLDGDTLAGPGMVAAHAAAHAQGVGLVGRGQTWNLRCTRFLRDPERGEFWPHEAHRAEHARPDELAASRVTVAQVRDDFEAVRRRATPGVYPGAGPRRLHEIEMRVLRERPRSSRLWAAASGSNLSVARELFLAAGGLDPDMDLNEHRELAYRLCAVGARLVAVDDAITYHLTHRSGWRDPLVEERWDAVFRRRHPEAPLDDLKRFWQGLTATDVIGFFDA